MDTSIKEEKDLEGLVAGLGHMTGAKTITSSNGIVTIELPSVAGSTSGLDGNLSQSPEPSSDGSCGEDDSGDEEKMMITIGDMPDMVGENSN